VLNLTVLLVSVAYSMVSFTNRNTVALIWFSAIRQLWTTNILNCLLRSTFISLPEQKIEQRCEVQLKI